MRKTSIERSLIALGVLGAFAVSAVRADESTTVSGKGFIDLTNYDLRNDGIDSAANGFGVDVKRFYLGVTHNFDDTWSAGITTDFNYVGNDNETQLFVKK